MQGARKLLVVCDDSAALERLAVLFAELGLQGDLACHTRAEDALECLAEDPFKVVFVQMTGGARAGVQVLQDFWKARPQMVRFLAAPSLDSDLMVECVVSAHHFLRSPLDLQDLKAALERAECIDHLVRNERIQALVSRMRTLPSRPTLYLEVLRELRSPSASAHAVGEIVARDLGISMKLIQVVNSAFYGLAQKVDEPSAAVFLLGLETTAALILSIEAFARFDKVKPLYFSTERVWRHSQSVAHAARKIAELMSNDPDVARHAFTAGLVHDIGKLALALNFEEQYQGALKLAEKNGLSPCEVEADVFGATHAETGAYLLSLWGLPLPIVQAVAGHHLPAAETGAEFSVLTALHLAERLHSEQEQIRNGVAGPEADLNYPAALDLQGRMDEFRLIVGGREDEDNGGTRIMTRAQLKASPVPVSVAAKPAPLLEVHSADSPISAEFLRRVAIPAVMLAAVAILGTGYMLVRSRVAEADLASESEEAPGRMSKMLVETAKAAPAEPAEIAGAAEPVAEEDLASKLKLQGIIYNGSRSSMFINGRSFRLGDEISGARIVAVQPEEVILEKAGLQHRLRLQ